MKTLTAVTLITSILLITFSKSIISLQYELNKKYIATTLCENRNNPQSHCNGSCHLKKTMNKDEQKENTPGGVSKDGIDIQLFSSENNYTIFISVVSSVINIYTVASYIEPSFSFFHPPKAA